MKVDTYAPNTYEDITAIQNLIANRKFKIHKSCVNSITQAQSYAWDKKAQQRGEDKPLKVDDYMEIGYILPASIHPSKLTEAFIRILEKLTQM